MAEGEVGVLRAIFGHIQATHPAQYVLFIPGPNKQGSGKRGPMWWMSPELPGSEFVSETSGLFFLCFVVFLDSSSVTWCHVRLLMLIFILEKCFNHSYVIRWGEAWTCGVLQRWTAVFTRCSSSVAAAECCTVPPQHLTLHPILYFLLRFWYFNIILLAQPLYRYRVILYYSI